MYEIIEECQQQNSYSQLIRTIGRVFSNTDALNKSFIKSKPLTSGLSDSLTLTSLLKEDLQAMEGDPDKDTDSTQVGEENVSNANTCSELADKEDSNLKPSDITVDIDAVRRVYRKMFAIPNLPFQDALVNAMTILSQNLQFEIKYNNLENTENFLNSFVILMEIPELQNTDYLKSALPEFCKAVGELSVHSQQKLARLWVSYDQNRLKDMVNTLQQLITVTVVDSQDSQNYAVSGDETVQAAAKVMKIVFYASLLGGRFDQSELTVKELKQEEEDEQAMQDFLQGAMGGPKEAKTPMEDPLSKALSIRVIDCREPVIPFADFQNDIVSEQLENDRSFHDRFCTSFPFLLTIPAKVQGMYFEHRLRMYNERRFSVLQALVHDAPPNPYLRLRVRRDHIIDDALVRVRCLKN